MWTHVPGREDGDLLAWHAPRSGVFFGLHRLVATLFRVWAETTFVLARICTQIMPGTEGTVCACRLIGGVHTSIHSGRASVRARLFDDFWSLD